MLFLLGKDRKTEHNTHFCMPLEPVFTRDCRSGVHFMDEPTNGLDPYGIHEIRNLIKSLPSLYDCTVLISSHMLSEIELIADDIGILNHGRMLFEGSMDELRQNAMQADFAADSEISSDNKISGVALEDMFLYMIDNDNKALEALPVRKKRAVL